MASVEADRYSLAVSCPRCGRPPLVRCKGEYGRAVPTHKARRDAGDRAAERRREGVR